MTKSIETRKFFDDDYGRHALTWEDDKVDVAHLVPHRPFHPTRLPDDYIGRHRVPVLYFSDEEDA